MKQNDYKSIHEEIMEEVNNNPILTEEEIKEMMEPESEDEIRHEEELTEAMFKRVFLIEEKIGRILSESEFKKVVTNEKIKRKIL
ncbi:MAG: hypothetical protein HDS38_00895 [Bacteroides sp.]|nr:hypothetical protein [Bacteroides sp.]